MEQQDWFAHWFNTAYYHTLYGHRDETEAEAFLAALCAKLQLNSGAAVIDIACGNGRHSRALHALGLTVTGIDLSCESIGIAKSKGPDSIHYHTQDMREALPAGPYQAAFNLFTSFGYFDDPSDDLRALQQIRAVLQPGSILVQDYLNGLPLIAQLPVKETINKESLQFHIHKYYREPFIYKEIEVIDDGKTHAFREQVRVFKPETLAALHEQAGFRVREMLGDYRLNAFDAASSPRIILISEVC
jgi:2-polyprenyl-3-methyl-5-hydroxy-6-metoxy-1,4-benzoquinol methylase